ncbi:MAG: hypothetical protein R3343_09420 [Nitriliruptorales bacterium]|nr:hypothetical protein [Nitriliruptorales bacterium]
MAATLVVLFSGSAWGQQGEFSIRPDPDRDVPEGRRSSYLIHDVSPGDVLEDRVEVVNLTNAPIQLLVESVDATLNADGAFAPAGPGTRREAGAWIELERNSLEIAPLGAESVGVTITVPSTAPAGDHVAAIVVQREDPDLQGNVRVVNRVGVRVYLTVGGGGPLSRDFSIAGFRWAGTPTDLQFEVEIVNTGQLLVEPAGTIEVSRDGTTVLRHEMPVLGGVPRQESRRLMISLPGELAGGTYVTDVDLQTWQGDAEDSAQTSFVLDADSLAGASEGEADPFAGRGPWLSGALLTFMITFLIVGFFALPLLRRKREQDEDAAAVTEAD